MCFQGAVDNGQIYVASHIRLYNMVTVALPNLAHELFG